MVEYNKDIGSTMAKDLDKYFSSLLMHVKMFEAAKTDPDMIELYDKMKVIYFLKHKDD